MSEEEQIKDIVKILELAKEEIAKQEIVNNNENITATLDLQDLKSLKNLYDLYQAEKEKNKKIEHKIKGKIEWYQQYCNFDYQTVRALEDILE